MRYIYIVIIVSVISFGMTKHANATQMLTHITATYVENTYWNQSQTDYSILNNKPLYFDFYWDSDSTTANAYLLDHTTWRRTPKVSQTWTGNISEMTWHTNFVLPTLRDGLYRQMDMDIVRETVHATNDGQSYMYLEADMAMYYQWNNNYPLGYLNFYRYFKDADGKFSDGYGNSYRDILFFNVLTKDITPISAPVPEPSTILLLAAGLTGIGILKRNKTA